MDASAHHAIGYDRLAGGDCVPVLPNVQFDAIVAGGTYCTREDVFRWKTSTGLSRVATTSVRTPGQPRVG